MPCGALRVNTSFFNFSSSFDQEWSCISLPARLHDKSAPAAGGSGRAVVRRTCGVGASGGVVSPWAFSSHCALSEEGPRVPRDPSWSELHVWIRRVFPCGSCMVLRMAKLSAASAGFGVSRAILPGLTTDGSAYISVASAIDAGPARAPCVNIVFVFTFCRNAAVSVRAQKVRRHEKFVHGRRVDRAGVRRESVASCSALRWG